VPDSRFVSYAQHGEDVVLWRALSQVTTGRYVEVGANDPKDLSITKAFYDRGWSGVTIDPVAEWAEAHRTVRPRDTFVQAAVTDEDIATIVLNEFPGTGLSTLDDRIAERHDAAGREHRSTTVPAMSLDRILRDAGAMDGPTHFMIVDTEGYEGHVLASVDLTSWRPWVLVVESTTPLGTEPTHADWEPGVLASSYEFCLFDGLSRFYVANEHAADLRTALSYPVCPLDDYVRADTVEAQNRIAELTRARDTAMEGLVSWRTEALHRWENGTSSEAAAELERLRRKAADLEAAVNALRGTLSWRVTAPLRLGRQLVRRGR